MMLIKLERRTISMSTVISLSNATTIQKIFTITTFHLEKLREREKMNQKEIKLDSESRLQDYYGVFRFESFVRNIKCSCAPQKVKTLFRIPFRFRELMELFRSERSENWWSCSDRNVPRVPNSKKVGISVNFPNFSHFFNDFTTWYDKNTVIVMLIS